MIAPRFALAAALFLYLVPAPSPLAAQTGTIAGIVRSGASNQPLSNVQISVEGTGLGGLTNNEGRILILQVPAGEHTVVAELIGYSPVRQTVTVVAGQTTAIDVRLFTSAVQIDGVVVTGTAVAAERRSVANATSLIMSRSRVQQLPGRFNPNFNTESYGRIVENEFMAVGPNPLSTFSIDVDRASYSNVRRHLRDGVRPPIDAVRIEELVNYFTYGDSEPEGDVPFSVTTEVAPAPWQPLHQLVRIGLKGRSIDMTDAPPSNLVFLLDVSGSMNSPLKLPLLKTALGMLVEQLRPEDRVAIVVYAGAAGLVLPSTPGSDKYAIQDALEGLRAGGSTAGGAGIRLAYDVAARNHIDGGNNRVILATDGDFNVGASSDAEMVRLIEEKREQGTFLTVLGFGTGNLQDSKMEQIADHGNGNFAYIDSALEARKVLVSEMGGTLLTIAQDVKIQVEFNPTRVAAYRLIGYENRLLADEDFDDDTKDAGELGAGHSVTALYEIIPVGVRSPVDVRGLDSLRYQTTVVRPDADDSTELLFVKLRYQEPGGSESRRVTHPVRNVVADPSSDFRFAAAVAAWGMLLRDSKHCLDFGLTDVARLARGALGEDAEGYRAEFLRLVELTRSMELLAMEPEGR